MLYPPIRHYLSLLLLLLLLSSVKRHAGVNCKDRLNIILVPKRSLYLCSCWCASYMISYHTNRARRYNLPHSSSGRQHISCKIADDRQQTTCEEHNATTLPHSSSGRQYHLCARGESSLCCGELLVSERVVICHPTIPHVSAVLPLWMRVSTDAET